MSEACEVRSAPRNMLACHTHDVLFPDPQADVPDDACPVGKLLAEVDRWRRRAGELHAEVGDLVSAEGARRERAAEALVRALQVDCEVLIAERDKLRASLATVLAAVDYERGACGPAEMIGAVLPADVLADARTAAAPWLRALAGEP